MILYNLSIYVLSWLIRIASWFNPKAKAFVNGRKDIISKIRKEFAGVHSPIVWVHCSSLGEFEQGRPVMEAFKTKFPSFKILLTFFSPSGYEIRKNYSGADWIYYLPLDTPHNAKHFVDIIKPSIAIFIKYEFWYNYSAALKKKNIPLLSVSCIFRKDQVFFKSYGKLFRKILFQFDYFFVQNKKSIELLATIGIKNASVAGDTRFDRVYQIISKNEEIPIAKKFKESQNVFVIGSCWPEDMDMVAPFINEHESSLKFIIAPHEVTEAFLTKIENTLEVKKVRYSKADENVAENSVLIIDNIGMLSRLYRYGEFAYVGGGFGKGLHNILEPACCGVPIFFGDKNYQKFEEANELIKRGGAFEISDYRKLQNTYQLMVSRPQNYLLACEVTKSYIEENLGATKKVMAYCEKLLQPK